MPLDEYFPVSELAEPRMMVSPSTLALAGPASSRPAAAPAMATLERARARIAFRARMGSLKQIMFYLPLTGGCSAWLVSAAFPAQLTRIIGRWRSRATLRGSEPPGRVVLFTDQYAAS